MSARRITSTPGSGWGIAVLVVLALALAGCGEARVQPDEPLGPGEGVVYLQVDATELGGLVAPGEMRLAFRDSANRWIGTAAFVVDPAQSLYALRLPEGRYRLGQVWIDGLTNLLLRDGVYPDFAVEAQHINYAGRLHLRREAAPGRWSHRPLVLAFAPSPESFEAATEQLRARYPALAARSPIGLAFPLEDWQPVANGPLALRRPTG